MRATREVERIAIEDFRETIDGIRAALTEYRQQVVSEFDSINGDMLLSGVASHDSDIIDVLDSMQSDVRLMKILESTGPKGWLNNEGVTKSIIRRIDVDLVSKALGGYLAFIAEKEEKRLHERYQVERILRNNPDLADKVKRSEIVARGIEMLRHDLDQCLSYMENYKKLIVEYEDEQSRVDQLREMIGVYSTYFENELNAIVGGLYDNIKLVMEPILNEYLQMEGRAARIEISWDQTEGSSESKEQIKKRISAIVKYGQNHLEKMQVSRYLNTFHYRMFVGAVNIAVALAARKRTGTNIPIVVDDLFYASDYENRSSVRRYIEFIFKKCHEVAGESNLQVILLTHDQWIFERLMMAPSNSEMLPMRFSKLFGPDEAVDADDYQNLVYTYPQAF